MKRYLFGLGAMIVGAGLMFVLMHGEVSAGIGKVYDMPVSFVCSEDLNALNRDAPSVFHCETKTLDCAVVGSNGVTCVKKGMFK